MLVLHQKHGSRNGGNLPDGNRDSDLDMLHRRLIGARQKNFKGRPLPGRADQVERAAVGANDPLRHSQSQAAARKFRSEERIEDPGLNVWSHPAARIGDVEPQVVAQR